MKQNVTIIGNNPLKTIFWGYHISGFKTLSYISESKYFDVIAVILPSNRKHNSINEIQEFCKKKNIKPISPTKIKTQDFFDTISNLHPDLYVVDSYTRLIPKQILEISRYGGVNLHPGILPKYKGAHTLNWCIINDEKASGLTLHFLSDKFDEGAVIADYNIELDPFETAKSLDSKLQNAIPLLLSKLEIMLEDNYISSNPQIGYFPAFRARTKNDGEILNIYTAQQIFNLVRAVSYPWPGAFILMHGIEIIIWRGLPLDINVSNHSNKLLIRENKLFLIGSDTKLFEIFEINDIAQPNNYAPLVEKNMINHIKININYDVI